jgi:N-acetylglucosaminyldiphosphoundecaprenol N-acetyl-beta-D-mannosaminyltransferase
MISKSDILGVKLAQLTLSEFEREIHQALNDRRKLRAFYVNAHVMNLAWSDTELRELLNSAEITYCDGFGVMLVGRLLGKNIPARYTSPDWLQIIGHQWGKDQRRIFWLGAKPGVAEVASQYYAERFPGVQTAGTHHGYFKPEDVPAIVEKINATKPDIVVVGLGTPLQEKWICDNFQDIDAFVFLPVGAAIDYLAGTLRRGPKWMTDNGLEWLSRLFVEPRRLWHRYFVGLPLLFWRVILYRFFGRKP